MTDRTLIMTTIVENGDLFDVVDELKTFGSMGPDPGTVIERFVRVAGVSREYADMLEREITRDRFDDNWPSDRNIFRAVDAVTRRIQMLAEDNPHFAECISTRAVY